MPLLCLRSIPIAALLLAAGCTVIQTGDEITSSGLLRAATPTGEAAPVDVYWAEIDQHAIDDNELWRQIEETRLPAPLRRRLASHGLRAGVVGNAVPDEVLRLLNPGGAEAVPDADQAAAGVQQLEPTGVSKATYSLTPGRRVEWQAGPSIPAATLLVPRGGTLVGATFNQAQPTYTLQRGEHDGGPTAKIRLTPELRHGEQRLRFRPDESGVISRAQPTRDAEEFPELTIEASLSPGESLLVTSTPGSDGRLGGYFHRLTDRSPKRRALIIRMAAPTREAAFDAEG